jgi:hypothetical protein
MSNTELKIINALRRARVIGTSAVPALAKIAAKQNRERRTAMIPQSRAAKPRSTAANKPTAASREFRDSVRVRRIAECREVARSRRAK